MTNVMIDSRLDGLTYEPGHFADIAATPLGHILWGWLRRVDIVARMEAASYLERAAVEPLGPVLLREFGEDVSEDRIKQLVGHMVRQIMEALGYELTQKGMAILKGLFSTGARYQRPQDVRDRSMRITREQRDAWLKKTADTPFNRWLKGRTAGADGRLDLGKLHDVARRYGVDDVDRYAELNPGQQRMSIGNRLRKLVPASTYDGA